MDINKRLEELQEFALQNKDTWHFTDQTGQYWGFIWMFNTDCRVILTLTPLGFCVRTHDRIHTTAGHDLIRVMDDVEKYFLDRYGHSS